MAAAALAPRFVAGGGPDAGLPGARGRPPDARARPCRASASALFAAGGTLLQTDGMQYTDASTSAFLTQFSAILIPVWLALRGRRNPARSSGRAACSSWPGSAVLGRFDWRTFTARQGGVGDAPQLVLLHGPDPLDREEGVCRQPPGSDHARHVRRPGGRLPGARSGDGARCPALLVPWRSPAWVGLTLAAHRRLHDRRVLDNEHVAAADSGNPGGPDLLHRAGLRLGVRPVPAGAFLGLGGDRLSERAARPGRSWSAAG